MSKINTDAVEPSTGTTLTLGASGDTVDIPSGATIDATGATITGWPSGGLSHASQWRITSNFTGSQDPISSNFEEVDTDGYGRLGSAMTESSGVFTFPATGYWRVDAQFFFTIENTDSRFGGADIQVSTDSASSWSQASSANASMYSSGASYALVYVTHQIDVTSTSTHKVRFTVWQEDSNTYIQGNSGHTFTGFTFTHLGDT